MAFALAFSCVMTGCFDTVQEITIEADGSGVMATTNDMSAIIGMAKQFGGDQMSELEKAATDTVVMLGVMADSIPGLTAEEKGLIQKGSLGIKMNMQEEVFTTRISYPFKSTSEINILNKLTSKVMTTVMDKQMSGSENPMMDNSPQPSSMEEYFNMQFISINIYIINSYAFLIALNKSYLYIRAYNHLIERRCILCLCYCCRSH